MKRLCSALIVTGMLLFAGLQFVGSALADDASKRPRNVVLILIDDMGYGDVAAHGNPVLKTPSFDRLHRTSAHFTNFAVSPSCAPTRAALLTGRHEFKSSVTHTILPMRNMDLNATTIAQLFQQKGFATGLFGKWHLGQAGKRGPWFRGFDETLTVAKDSQGGHFDPTLLKNRVKTKFKGYRTDILFNEAMAFMERNREKPFFCYLPTYTPHAPLKVAPNYSKPYEGREGVNAKFSGMVANVDENIGRLLDRLAKLKLESDTLVIVISDNGGTFGVDTWNAGMRGTKGSVWRGGTRAVSFWRWGDRFPAGPRPQMTGHVDVFATLADLFRLDVSKPLAQQLDGDSLQPLLEDAQAVMDEDRMQVHHRGRWNKPANWQRHKYTYCCVRWKNFQLVRIETCDHANCTTCKKIRQRTIGRNGAVRTYYSRNIKHARMTKRGEWELYDFTNDPFQEHNLADEKPEIVKKMTSHYEGWWKDVSPVLADPAN